MDISRTPRGWGGMAAGHGGRPISPIHRNDGGGIGTPPSARLGGGHRSPFSPYPVGVIKFDPAKKPPRPPKPPKRGTSGKLHAHAGGGLGGGGGGGGSGGTVSPRHSRRRKAVLLLSGMRGRQKSTETSKAITTVMGVILTLLFGLLLLVQGVLVKEPPPSSSPSSAAVNSVASSSLPTQNGSLETLESKPVPPDVTGQTSDITGGITGRRGGQNFIPKESTLQEENEDKKSLVKFEISVGSAQNSGQQPRDDSAIRIEEPTRGVSEEEGSRVNDDADTGRAGLIVEGRGKASDIDSDTASGGLGRDDARSGVDVDMLTQNRSASEGLGIVDSGQVRDVDVAR